MIVAAIEGLFLLVMLACPIGMLLMMWFMGRGMMGGKSKQETEITGASLPDLKAEQARLAEKIEALEAERPRGQRYRQMAAPRRGEEISSES